MLESVLQKHVLFVMANGTNIGGFVVENDENFFKIVEQDNSVCLVRISDVSCVKIFNYSLETSRPVTHQPIIQQEEKVESKDDITSPQAAMYIIGRGNQFSMSHSNAATTPKFERQT